MRKTKEQKGITLIALIITIVVLLILAIVTIGAVNESGIIKHAQNAKNDYTVAQEKEQIELAVSEWKLQKVISGDNAVFKDVIIDSLQEQNISITGEDKGPLTVIMKSGTAYTVTENGVITKIQTENLDGEGGKTEDIIDEWKDNGDGTYTKGDETIEIGVTTYTNDQVLEQLGVEKSEYTGTYGKKTGETWTVIGVEGNKIKLVSTTNVASNVRLGVGDPGAIEAVPLKEGEALTETIKIQRTIWSYNHAMDTIKTAVETATKGMPEVKSITREDIENILNITEEQKRTLNTSYGRTYRYYYQGDKETGKVYKQYLDWNETDTELEDTTEEGWSNGSGTSYNIFISYDKVIDGTDENKDNVVKLKSNYYRYKQAFVDTKFINSLGTGYYWLAMPCVSCTDREVYFGVCYVKSGEISYGYLLVSYGSLQSIDTGVRAIVYI